MEKDDIKEEIFEDAKRKHAFLDKRLQMLLRKPYLTEEEEMEIKILKKKKLYYKDIMERAKEDIERGEKG